MKLLTLNCHSWQEENQIEKIKYLAKVIKEKQYDVVALQEISQRIDSKVVKDNIKEDNFVYLLVKELEFLGEYNYSYIWDFSHIGYDIYEEGLAILTNKNIKNSSSFYISKSNDKNFYKSRNIIKATIEVEDENYDIYSCHLGWWGEDKEPFEYQANELIRNISKSNTNFIMGDFNNNAFVIGEGYNYLLDKGLVDTYNIAKDKDNGITVGGEIDGWKNNSDSKRLDLILSTEDINVVSSKVIFNSKNYNVISDHFGVEIITQ
ncbi:endonuclease/exonuclease/phosphatase family protein [Clostridium gasigenes]|uniref:endonuclease/exonuclease/phosphatase family protein n=1 Tax=Clostridium gasigenes TaxID=94869 RepID=UPI001C0CEC99|nr:endonuclease/exonuclease/phosphatase family protein [Clostridium gasigenes]MBU3136824.1 endonuclease/exonuclease/phosphatase family protein [Clostridium gasigenes]